MTPATQKPDPLSPVPGSPMSLGVKRKTANTVEPVFWRARPARFYENLVADYKLDAIVDLAAGDGTLMAFCAKDVNVTQSWGFENK